MTLFLSSDMKSVELNNIICFEKIKNNIMNNSYFYKLIYSDEFCSFNGIFFIFKMKNIKIEKYFNKLKCNISNLQHNLNQIKNICLIEEKILHKFKEILHGYTYKFRIKEQLKNMNIKLQNNENYKYTNYDNLTFLLKISGIWSSSDKKETGLTFKFFIVNKSV